MSNARALAQAILSLSAVNTTAAALAVLRLELIAAGV